MGQRDTIVPPALRASIHALVDGIEEDDLPLAHEALAVISRGFVATEDERRELEERFAACDRGEGIEARAFLQRLRERDEQAARR